MSLTNNVASKPEPAPVLADEEALGALSKKHILQGWDALDLGRLEAGDFIQVNNLYFKLVKINVHQWDTRDMEIRLAFGRSALRRPRKRLDTHVFVASALPPGREITSTADKSKEMKSEGVSAISIDVKVAAATEKAAATLSEPYPISKDREPYPIGDFNPAPLELRPPNPGD